jgi:hypothetical protein
VVSIFQRDLVGEGSTVGETQIDKAGEIYLSRHSELPPRKEKVIFRAGGL